MEFTIDRDNFLKSIGHANGIIEKKNNLTYTIKNLNQRKRIRVLWTNITERDLDQKASMSKEKRNYNKIQGNHLKFQMIDSGQAIIMGSIDIKKAYQKMIRKLVKNRIHHIRKRLIIHSQSE